MNSTSPFQSEPWSRTDWLGLAGLVCLSGLMLGMGLWVRPLWGPEGRWAMVVREMLRSGNYFLPTVNGIVDFDKPLLSYWAILPFAWVGGLSEAALRMPSVLSGIGTILITFAIGRRLFGWKAGALASVLLMTTGMFVTWTRTASADLLNLVSIWFMFWCFLAGGWEGKLKQLVLMYGVGALASFLKGPVAPAVALFALALYSSTSMLLEVRNPTGGSSLSQWVALKSAFRREFRWIVSLQALTGLLAGTAIFSALFLLPEFMTGSWVSAQLMWRENVVRFLHPFDHAQPAYAYSLHLFLLSAPWTLLVAAAVWECRRWEAGRNRRWLALVTFSIFFFFALSKSRRGYYLLPILPALALFAGRVLSDALDVARKRVSWAVRTATLMTSGLVLLAGLAAVGAYATLEDYHNFSGLAVALCAIGGSSFVLWLLTRPKLRNGLIVALSLIFVMEMWVFTKGMQLAEQGNTLQSYCTEVKACLANVDDHEIGVFRENAALLFYLNRKRLHEIESIDDLGQFEKEHPEGFVIADLNDLAAHGELEWMNGMTVILAQGKDTTHKRGARFALLRVGSEKFPVASEAPLISDQQIGKAVSH